jgi:flagellar hook-associated protein 2
MSSMGSIDVAGLVGQLMQVERMPVDFLASRRTGIQRTADAYDGLKKLLDDITTKANAFDAASEWNLLKASSSSTSVTTAVTGGGFSGSLAFKVTGLAASQKLYSVGTVSSTSDKVTTATNQLVAAGGAALGFSGLSGSPTLSLGTHTVEVTQASSAAVKTGPWPTSKVSFDADHNSMVIMLNGTEYTVALSDGQDLDHDAVVQRLNDSFAAAGIGGQLTAGLTASGDLQLRTTGEGSVASLQITGGTALSALGLSVDAAALRGTDGKVKVDGVEQTLTDIRPNATTTLPASTGSINATFSGGLRVGSVKAGNVSLGDGSLASVVSAINGSGSDVTASAIKVGEGQYRLQIQSKLTGSSGQLNFDTSMFDQLGSFATVAGSDATIELITDRTFTLTSSSNTFKDVLPGVSFTVSALTTEPVTVSADRDQDALTGKVQAMIDSVNKALSDIKAKSAYDATNRSGGVLVGEHTVSRLRSALVGAVTGAVAGGDLTQAGQAGITMNKDGSLAFDKAKFATAYAANPAGVQRLFVAPPEDTATAPGITQRVATAVKAATDFTTGYVTMAARNRKDAVTDVNKQIDRWEDRLVRKQQSLTAIYSNLNTALTSLGQQSQWLMGQISSLG